MLQNNISNEFISLPPEARRQLLDFMEFLKSKYANQKIEKKTDVRNEAFIGMWADRVEMEDSSRWVRNLRNKEWGTPT